MRFIDWDEPSALVLAPQLLGWELVGREAAGRIVEVEAYEPDDPASHTFRGETNRNRVMFGPAGRLYTYLNYGVHTLANVVVGPPGRGCAVLIRALEPTSGVDQMRRRRGTDRLNELCSGPGKLSQALGVTLEDNGSDLLDPASAIRLTAPVTDSVESVVAGPRIGISKATERPWRFGIASSEHLSRTFPP